MQQNVDPRFIKLAELINPVVSFLTTDLSEKNVARHESIKKLQESVFWGEKAINDEILAKKTKE